MRLATCLDNFVNERGFVYGWEGANIGNCVCTMANMIAFSERTGIPAIYPQIRISRSCSATSAGTVRISLPGNTPSTKRRSIG